MKTQGPSAEDYVLLVEDDPDIRGVMTDILQLEGHTVKAAGNGSEAMELLGCGPAPRLILLDLMMPVMNGWEFRRAQAKDPRLASVPVVILTGGGDAAQTAASMGVAGWLRKPVDLDDLLALVQRYPPASSPAPPPPQDAHPER